MGAQPPAASAPCMDVLVDGPSEDPAFAWEGRTAGQAPEIDGVVYLRDGAEGVRGSRPDASPASASSRSRATSSSASAPERRATAPHVSR